MELMQVARRERLTGQQSFFGDMDQETSDPTIEESEFDGADLLTFEKELLGLYVTAHPLDGYREMLAIHCLPLEQVCTLGKGDTATLAGRVRKVRRIDTRRGDQMAFVTLEDGRDDIEVTVFPRVLEGASELFVEDMLIAISISAGKRNGEANLVAESVSPIRDLPNRGSLAVTVRLDDKQVDELHLSQLLGTLEGHPGSAPVRFRLVHPDGGCVVAAGGRFTVSPTESLRASLTHLSGVIDVSFTAGDPA